MAPNQLGHAGQGGRRSFKTVESGPCCRLVFEPPGEHRGLHSHLAVSAGRTTVFPTSPRLLGCRMSPSAGTQLHRARTRPPSPALKQLRAYHTVALRAPPSQDGTRRLRISPGTPEKQAVYSEHKVRELSKQTGLSRLCGPTPHTRDREVGAQGLPGSYRGT